MCYERTGWRLRRRPSIGDKKNRRVGKTINKPNGAKQHDWVYSSLRIGSKEEIFAPQSSCSYVVDAQETTA